MSQTAVTEEKADIKAPIEPPSDTPEWILYWGELEGHLPTPIPVSITGSTVFRCSPLEWYNFDVCPHKIKLTNTGFTLIMGAKWMTERPFLSGGSFLEKMVFSQIHFHWGKDLMEGSEHSVDDRMYPGEVQVTFFKSEYMTQQEALWHKDGVVIISYMIKYGVNPDPRLQWIIDAFPRIRESKTFTKIGPFPLSRLLPMFYEDYFLYWGTVSSGFNDFTVRFVVPRTSLSASFDQMKEFRKLWNPWDEPIVRNFRPLQERKERHIFFINPHWSLHTSLLPTPTKLEKSISKLSPAYLNNTWILPPQNTD